MSGIKKLEHPVRCYSNYMNIRVELQAKKLLVFYHTGSLYVAVVLLATGRYDSMQLYIRGLEL